MSDTVTATTTPGLAIGPRETVMLGVLIPAELQAELARLQAKHNLSKSAVTRMSLERGLPLLAADLEIKTEAQP